MIWKNLKRRKGRTLLTLAGIALGVASIVALGAMADGMREGYGSMAQGSQADLVLTPKGMMDVTIGAIDEAVGERLRGFPEVEAVEGMLIGAIQVDTSPYFFIFGYDLQGFSLPKFRIVDGQGLGEARPGRVPPIILGREASRTLNKGIGESVRLTGGTFRVVGVYETGDSFEDSGAVITLSEAQRLLMQPRRVSMYYVRLEHDDQEVAFRARAERTFRDLTVQATSEFADTQEMLVMMEAFAWGVAALAVIVGGVGMANTLFMSVSERTPEIGLLRAVGWRRRQVMGMILGEAMALSAVGGVVGALLGVVAVTLLRSRVYFLGSLGMSLSPELFGRAGVTVLLLGLAGGAYPAWQASRLLPIEAMRADGGGAVVPRRLPGGMVVRGLWRRGTRTLLTAVGISVGIAAIVSLGAVVNGMLNAFTEMATASYIDILAYQADVSDLAYSAVDDRTVARLAAQPGVVSAAGGIFNAASTEKAPIVIVLGYPPGSAPMVHLRPVEGGPITASRQILLGRRAAETLGLEVGSLFRLSETAYRVVGIYESGVSWEQGAVVMSLRDAQTLFRRPRQSSLVTIKVSDPRQVEEVRARLAQDFPELSFALSAKLGEEMEQLALTNEMIAQIAVLALGVGALGTLNTMLMAVRERTREIGVLRAVGWRRRQVLRLILFESLTVGILGGAFGIGLGLLMAWGIANIPTMEGMMNPVYTPGLFIQALLVGLGTGILGGLYPAWRATRMSPVEALRYE